MEWLYGVQAFMYWVDVHGAVLCPVFWHFAAHVIAASTLVLISKLIHFISFCHLLSISVIWVIHSWRLVISSIFFLCAMICSSGSSIILSCTCSCSFITKDLVSHREMLWAMIWATHSSNWVCSRSRCMPSISFQTVFSQLWGSHHCWNSFMKSGKVIFMSCSWLVEVQSSTMDSSKQPKIFVTLALFVTLSFVFMK